MPSKKPPHLRRLPEHVADRLTPEAKRDLADLATDLERDRRDLDARGWAAVGGVPAFLAPSDAAAPGAADLWRVLPRPAPSGASLPTLHALGHRLGLTPEATDCALDALRSRELVGTAPEGGIVALSPVID